MNTAPILHNKEVRNDGCGRLAVESAERSFWQSKATVAGQRAEPFDLVDIPSLARDIRKGEFRS